MARPTNAPSVPNTETTKVRKQSKPHRWKSGTQALRQIRRLQKSVELQIPKAVNERLIRERAQGLRIDKDVVLALQTACEAFAVERLRYSNLVAVSRGSLTLTAKDMKVVAAIENKTMP